MAQGDEPNAKDDTRFYGTDRGSGWSDLAEDVSHQATNLTVGTNCIYQSSASARWDVSAPAAWELDIDANDTDAGYLFTYEDSGNGVRLEMSSGGVIDAYVDGASVAQVTIPDIDAGGDNVIVSWSMEANPLTTGASDAVRSELRVYNVDDSSYAQAVAEHAEVSSATATAIWGASATGGTNAYTGTVNEVRFSAGRFHPASEMYQDFVSTTSAPTLVLASRREVPVPTRASGVGAHDQLAGPVYQSVGAGLLQADLRQAGHILSELYVDPPDLSNSYPANRELADPDGDGFTMLGQYLRLRPVPRTCNRLKVRVHLQCWRTDANAPDEVYVRVYTMNRPPTGLVNIPPPQPPWLRFYGEQTRENNDGSGTTGGAYLTFDEIEVVRTPGGGGTWLALAFDVRDAGGVGPTSAQRWRVRSWSVEPGIEEVAGEFPIGGFG